MARVKNATFVGNPPSDVDVDSPSWTRVIKNAIGDLALVYDKVTGLNAEAQTITHNGTRGRGARLGIPWVNQTFSGRGDRAGQWGIDLAYTAATGTGGGKAASFATDTIIFGVPVFIPPGEEDMTIMITGRGLDVWPWRAELLLESTGARLFASGLTYARDASGTFDTLSLSTNENGTAGATTGKLCLLLIYADTTHTQQISGTTPSGQVRVFSLFAGPTRIRSGSASLSRNSTDPYGITAGAPGFGWRDFDATLFADKAPLHSYLTGGASRNLNALIEYITGWPVGGNLSYTLADNAANNPSISRFLAHTLSTHATEPAIAFPMFAQAMGAAMLSGYMVIDGPMPTTTGMLDWYAMIPQTAAQTRHMAWLPMMPDFPTGTSKLKSCTLAINGRATDVEGVKWSTQWDFGAAAVSAAAPFVTVGATKLMTAKNTSIPFVADDVSDDTEFILVKSAALVAFDEIGIMGTCTYFEP